MVEDQLRDRGIADERVLAAMAAVPRERFVPERERPRAYIDAALPLGYGQTISQPFMVARICELLALRGEERVLDVGTGSGYQAAVLAELVGDVHSIERLPELAERARTTLAELGYEHAPHRPHLHWFCKPSPAVREFHLILVERTHPEWTARLRFRDRLRADHADRERYAAAKRELAARDWKFVQQYADAKTEVVHEILARAEAPQS